MNKNILMNNSILMIRIIHFPFQYLTKHYPFQFNSYPFQFNPYPFHYLINAYPFQFNPYPFQYSICDLVLSCIRILVLCIICILIAKRKRLENVYKILFFFSVVIVFFGVRKSNQPHYQSLWFLSNANNCFN